MENKVRRCIFHIPNKIEPNATSGSNLRPLKMIEAFTDNGYIVDCVMGYGEERKTQIKQIKNNIREGKKYDFVYSESSTMPTLLTEKNHFPRYPFLDFGFLKYCRKQGMKVGLFYRDIYWKFPVYKEVSWKKRLFSVPLYKYDLRKYKKNVDVLYLPSERMFPYVNIPIKHEELPPGCELPLQEMQKREFGDHRIRLFYVGGIGSLYDLTELLCAVKRIEFAELTVCCREKEWEKYKGKYGPYLSDRVTIIHKSGDVLQKYYRKADMSMLFFKSDGYRKFAMPIKLFEYISNLTPVVAVKGSAAGDFVEEHKAGWSIEHKSEALEELLKHIYSNRKLLTEKQEGMRYTLRENTWQRRAEQVVRSLTSTN